MNERLQSLTIDAQAAADACQQYGVPVPKDLAAALDVWKAAAGYEGPTDDELTAPLAKLRTAKPADVPKIAEEVATLTNLRAAIATARDDILDAAARRVAAALEQSIDAILTALEPTFTDAAATFAEAHKHLPPRWDRAESLASATPDQLAAYVTCRDTVGTLDALAKVRRRIAPIPLGDLAQGTAFCRVIDSDHATYAARAETRPPLGKWGSLLEIPGTQLRWWPTRAAHAQHVADLAAAHAAHVEQRQREQWPTNRPRVGIV